MHGMKLCYSMCSVSASVIVVAIITYGYLTVIVSMDFCTLLSLANLHIILESFNEQFNSNLCTHKIFIFLQHVPHIKRIWFIFTQCNW